MKKLTLLVAAIATLFSTSLFTFCSEPESAEPTIVGTWEYVQVDQWGTAKLVFVFNADGSGSFTAIENSDTDSFQQTTNFEYLYYENTSRLVFISDSQADIFDETNDYDAIITANKLKLKRFQYESSSRVLKETIVFTRLK